MNSGFELAAEHSLNEYLPPTNRRKTLVILGDARNNGKEPNTYSLEEPI